jgi:hypothetical protein
MLAQAVRYRPGFQVVMQATDLWHLQAGYAQPMAPPMIRDFCMAASDLFIYFYRYFAILHAGRACTRQLQGTLYIMPRLPQAVTVVNLKAARCTPSVSVQCDHRGNSSVCCRFVEQHACR